MIQHRPKLYIFDCCGYVSLLAAEPSVAQFGRKHNLLHAWAGYEASVFFIFQESSVN